MDASAMVRLRTAMCARDGASLVAELTEEVVAEVPQLAGNGLLSAIGQKVPGADRLARSCSPGCATAQATVTTTWRMHLEAALAMGPQPLLRPIPVDLGELADALEGDPMLSGGRLDLRTGDVWPGETYDLAEFGDEEDQEDDEEGRWL